MNLFTKGMINCPKCCLQNCEYSEECMAKARSVRNSLIGLIFSKLKAVISRGKLVLGRLIRKERAYDFQFAEPYKPIHPTAKYKFSRTNDTAFVLDQHIGKRLFEVQTVHLKVSPLPLMFSHSLEDDKGGIITTLTFLPELERRSCGAYNNHAMLLELSEDCKELTMLVFENMGIYQTELLQRWNVGELVVAVEVKPLLEDIRADKHSSEKCSHNNVYVYALYKSLTRLVSLGKKEPGAHV